MEDIRFGPATAADLPEVRMLLDRCELPSADLQPGHLGHFVLCRVGDSLAGSVGLEVIADIGLLRSLAVAPGLRRRGLAHDLWRRVQARARDQGIRRLYLLTTTAEPLFARWGFQRVARDVVPEAIRATAEFGTLCPSTAAVMVMDLATAGIRGS